LHDLGGGGDPRTEYRHLGIDQGEIVTPGLDLGSEGEKLFGAFQHRRCRGTFRNADLGIELEQRARRAEPTHAETDDQYALPCELAHSAPPFDRKSA
jgi:hypothetical protein